MSRIILIFIVLVISSFVLTQAYGADKVPAGAASPWIGRMIYGVSIVFMTAVAIGLIVFAYVLLPKTKKAKTCPVAEFARAQQIRIPLPRGEEVIVKPGAASFVEFIDNFTDETKDPSYELYSDKLYIKIDNQLYAIEASLDGWNFEGEERNRRRLRNPIQVIEIVDSFKDTHFKAKKT
jgi:hypothetical protein